MIEFFAEIILEGILEGIFTLLQLIIPKKSISKGLQITLKTIVAVITAIFFVIMFLGVIAMFSDDADTHRLGMYMFFVPLGIIILQITAGIIVNTISKRKK